MLVCSHFPEVLHILAGWEPGIPPFFAAGVGPEAPLVEGVDLAEAEEVELDPAFLCIFDREIEPLHVPVGVGVKAHVEIVLLGGNPQIYPEVPSRPSPGCPTRTCC